MFASLAQWFLSTLVLRAGTARLICWVSVEGGGRWQYKPGGVSDQVKSSEDLQGVSGFFLERHVIYCEPQKQNIFNHPFVKLTGLKRLKKFNNIWVCLDDWPNTDSVLTQPFSRHDISTDSTQHKNYFNPPCSQVRTFESMHTT